MSLDDYSDVLVSSGRSADLHVAILHRVCLQQQLVGDGGLSMVDMRNDGKVADPLRLNLRAPPRRSRGERGHFDRRRIRGSCIGAPLLPVALVLHIMYYI